MLILNIITDWLEQNWIPNLLGLLGGLLGLWTFVDNYFIAFKPKIYIGTRVVLEMIKDKGALGVNSLICSFELCNHRKKYGVVYDLAVRIYHDDAINAKPTIFYASQLIEKVPVNIDDLDEQPKEIFNPITVLPSSNRSVNVVLSDLTFNSNATISMYSSYFFEAYFQKEPKGKWYLIDTLYLFDEFAGESIDSKYRPFLALESDTTREKIKKSLRPQKISVYKGSYHKQLELFLQRISYRYLQNPIDRVKDIFLTIPFYTQRGFDWFFDKKIRLPIITRYAKKLEEMPKVRINSPELKPITEKAYEKIYDLLVIHIEEINKDASLNAKLSLSRDEDNQIVLSRNSLGIKFYISGGDSIIVQQNSKESSLNYRLRLKTALWNRKYWYLENFRFITLESFVLRVLDAFIFRSNF